jgi:hypothetical protein
MPQAKHPLFPRTIDSIVADLNTKKNYLESNNVRLNIPASELLTINMQITSMNDAYTIARDIDVRSKIDIAIRDTAIDIARETMRRVIFFYVVKNPNANTVDYEALRIPIPGSGHRLPAPDSAPGIKNIVSHDLSVTIKFYDASTGKRAKPDGVQSIEIIFKLGGEYPTDISDLTERLNATSSPASIRFAPSNEFEVLYVAFRWIGTRGDFGPWSEIYKVIIVR